MKVNILAFGQIADIVGKQQWEAQGPENSGVLVQQLKQQYPQLQSVKFSVAVNKNVVRESVELKENDTVALLPPFSGG